MVFEGGPQHGRDQSGDPHDDQDPGRARSEQRAAQHFYCTFHQASPGSTGPTVSEAFAFDPSPVTGWSSADDPLRTHNASGVVVNRLFEHGEVLAYVRLLTSRLAVSAKDPAIWAYRYNFDPRANIVRNHSMRSLACGLARAAAESR